MSRLIKFLSIVLLASSLCSCNKEEVLYKADDVNNLTKVLTWYGKSGVEYTYENFVSVAGSQISFGMRTDELIHACSFRKSTHTSKEATGTGIDKVYYQKPGATFQTHMNVSYKELSFEWKFSNDILSITYTTKDDLIKDASYGIAWISDNSISSSEGTGVVAKVLFSSDRSKVEK